MANLCLDNRQITMRLVDLQSEDPQEVTLSSILTITKLCCFCFLTFFSFRETTINGDSISDFVGITMLSDVNIAEQHCWDPQYNTHCHKLAVIQFDYHYFLVSTFIWPVTIHKHPQTLLNLIWKTKCGSQAVVISSEATKHLLSHRKR